MGLPLAGKTTWINENIPMNQYIVSADRIKETHPDYNPDDCEVLHEYSVSEAEKMMNELSDGQYDIIMDSGSINNRYTKRIIAMLKSKSYYVELVHVKTPYDVCLQRNKLRERKVPESAIIDKAIRENAQFYKLVELVDKVVVVNYFTNKNLFIDMDGVICALSTLPIINGEIDFVNSEIYKYLPPVTQVLDKLKILSNEGYNIYVLSATPNSFSVIEKNEWLDKHFPIPKEYRYFVNQGKHKAEMLENLSVYLKLEKRNITMVDDMHDTLYSVKKRGMNSMHVSEFLIHKFDSI